MNDASGEKKPSRPRPELSRIGRAPGRSASRTIRRTLGDTGEVRVGLDDLLHAGADEEAQIWGLPGNDAAARLAREARYQVTRTVAIVPRDRDDALISVVIEVLDRHPVEPVARILHAAARNTAAGDTG